MNDIEVVLTVMRCCGCSRVMFDADVRAFGVCPHCGGRRISGSGNTTIEEENWLEKWALRNYDRYRQIEIDSLGARLQRGDTEGDTPPTGRHAVRLERGTCVWAAGSHRPKHLPRSTGYPGQSYPVLGEQVEKAAEAQ